MECEMLATMPAFAHMTSRQLKLLAMSSERREFAPGEHVFRQGEPASEVFLLLNGAIECHALRDDVAVSLDRVSGTTWLGTAEALQQKPRNSTATAATHCVVLKLDQRDFLELVEQIPCFGLALSKQLAARINQVTDMLIEAKRS